MKLGKNHGDGGKKVEERLSFRERRYEKTRRMRIKRSEEYEVLEEVFDKSTLMTIYRLMNRGVIDQFFGAVKSGKEAKIYSAMDSYGRELAVKIFLTVSAEFKKGMLPYLQGDPRFRRVRHDTRSLIYAWTLKEFKNLTTSYDVGVPVPKPFAVENNVLVIEFIGEKGVPAPLLKEVELRHPRRTYDGILQSIKTLYREAGLVHGDLSEYNVMFWKNMPVIFDLSQAVVLSHPMAVEILRRDLGNINRFFEKLNIKVKTVDEIYKWITKDGYEF